MAGEAVQARNIPLRNVHTDVIAFKLEFEDFTHGAPHPAGPLSRWMFLVHLYYPSSFLKLILAAFALVTLPLILSTTHGTAGFITKLFESQALLEQVESAFVALLSPLIVAITGRKFELQ